MYSFSFTYFFNSVVKLVAITCSYLNGKNIRQRFTNDSEKGSWSKIGESMDCDSQDISGDFTVNFFDESKLAKLDERPSSSYKFLKLSPMTDYLNHEVQLL